jgi:membrane protein DedA with SNARE-associated domain
MENLLSLIGRHGYLLVALGVFAEAIGLPLPASVVLVTAGAAASAGILHAPLTLGLAVAAMLLGDSLLFVLGRYTGWGLLGFLCRLSVNPETCILRSAESFYKRGRAALVVAKFIPGVNTMAPPLAGSMMMRPLQFLRYDAAGAALYVSAYFGVGFLFRDFLVAIVHSLRATGQAMEVVLAVALLSYMGYRIWLYRKTSIYRVVPRVPVEELARKLATEDRDRLLLIDVRSHGYYDGGAMRLKGSVRIEPNNLSAELGNLPKDKDLYLYCT